MERIKTISKHFFDDEVLFKDDNGDIHLKEGVTRLKYQAVLDPQLLESYLNDDALAIERQNRIQEQLGINEGDKENDY